MGQGAGVVAWRRLRGIFDEDAALYERCRPGYPVALFAGLPVGPGSRVLEIGCGTGQATLPLAELGCVVTAVELGPGMAAVARGKLAAFPVSVEVGAFEDWALPAEPFDLVLAATSFHWVDPGVRVAKCLRALRRGGALAVVSTHHIAGGTSAFFVDAQGCYERFDPDTPPGLRPQPASGIPVETGEFRGFGSVVVHRYEWEVTYSTREYLDLLHTYSGHRALPEVVRRGLFACLRRLIERDHGGFVTKRYLTQSILAVKG